MECGKIPTLGLGNYRVADPNASEYHLNSVPDKTALADPRRSPGPGMARSDATPPATGCIDPAPISDPPALLFYQALSA